MGNTWSDAYDQVGNLSVLTDPQGRTTEMSYDDRNLLIEVDYQDLTTPDAHYSYDALSRMETMTDGLGTQRYEYDAVGQIVEISRNGRAFGYDYGGHGLVTDRIYPDGSNVGYGYAYDIRDRVTSEDVTSDVFVDQAYGYDANGNRVVRSHAGVPEALTFDEADRLIERTVNGETEVFSHDDSGNMVADGEWVYTYDQLNRLVRAEQISGASDYASIVLEDSPVAYWDLDEMSSDDSYANLAETTVGALDGPDTRAPRAIDDGAVASGLGGIDGAYRFDGNGDRIDIETVDAAVALDGDHTIEFWVRLPEASGRRRTLMYLSRDGAPNPWRITVEADGELRFLRDGLRLTSGQSIATGEWTHVAFSYDGDRAAWVINGEVAREKVGVELSAIDLDSVDFLRIRPGLGMDLDELAVYDDALTLERLADHAGATVAYEATIESDAPASWWRFNEPQGSLFAFDSAGDSNATLTPIRVPAESGSPLGVGSALSFDGVDDRLRVSDDELLRLGGAFSVETWVRSDVADDPNTGLVAKGSAGRSGDGWRIRRIGDGRLEFLRNGLKFATTGVAVDGDWSHVAVTFDGAELSWYIDGELDSVHEVTVPFAEVVTPDKNLVVGTRLAANIEMDELAIFDRALSPDEIVERVDAVMVGGEGTVVVNKYDGNGLRLASVVDGVETTYEWDQVGSLPQIALEAGPGADGESEVRRFSYVGGSPHRLDVIGDGETDGYYLHQDVLGSTVAVTDADGGVVSELAYDAAGNVSYRVDHAAAPLGVERFADGRWDAALGVWHLRARFYDPELGQFLTTDPLDTPMGDPYVSRYSYVGGRYTTMTDASGLRAVRAGLQSAQNMVLTSVAEANASLAQYGIDVHLVLDVLGMVPVFGEGFDVINGVIYLAEGDVTNATISFAAVFFIGSAGTGARLAGRFGDELVQGAGMVARHGDEGLDVASVVVRNSDELAGNSRFVDNVMPSNGTMRHADTPHTTSVSRADGASCPIGNSFVPGTLVVMGDGSSKPIEDVEPGDWVWSEDPVTGEAGARLVTALIEGFGFKTLVDIGVEGGTFTATDEHPVWVSSSGAWVDAEDVRPGDYLLDSDGVRHVVGDVVVRGVVGERVHNLTVDGLHTYFVQAGDTSILTHNCGPTSAAPNRVPELALPSTINNAGAPIRSFVTQTDTMYYRVYSGDSTVGGFLTSAPPRSSAEAISSLALPPGNQASYVQEVLVPGGTRLQSSLATEAFGQPGGALQFQLLDEITRSSFGPGRPLG